MSDSLLPNNSTTVEIALEGAMSRISNVPVRARDMANADAAPAATLPWLAWGVSVDDWQTDWTDRQKRDTIKASNSIHRYKGTIGAVRESLAALGFGVEVIEWFNQEPPGEPYTFRLRVTSSQDEIPQGDWGKLITIVNNAKNLRSHLDSIDLVIVSDATPVLGAALMMGSEIQIEPGGGNLLLDGTWTLDGSYRLNGLRIPI